MKTSRSYISFNVFTNSLKEMLLLRFEAARIGLCRLMSTRCVRNKTINRSVSNCSQTRGLTDITDDDSENISTKCIAKHEFPDKLYVKRLKDKFPEPSKMITEIYQPLVETNKERAPVFSFVPKLNGRLWKAQLHFNFPACFYATGIHSDLEKAKENTYLEACRMCKELGFLHKNNTKITPESLFTTLELLIESTISPMRRNAKNLQMATSHIVDNGSKTWVTKIVLKWPCLLSTEAKGYSSYNSQYEAALLLAHKLKCHGLLDSKRLPRNLSYCMKSTSTCGYLIPSVEDFDPDCIIHVDASKQGFGAYLKMKDENGVRWLTEQWPNEIKSKYFMSSYISTFGELYALVTACYTWKHKFVNKRVLCYTDCFFSATIINRGLYWSNYFYTFSKYQKLCNILLTTAQKYEIDFLACHLSRDYNGLADMLSRLRVEQFKEEVPEAHEKSKKTKHLLFSEPLIIKAIPEQYCASAVKELMIEPKSEGYCVSGVKK